jgi:hypothetical protein
MQEAQKKKLVDLIVRRLAEDGAATATVGAIHYVDLEFLDRTLEALARNGFESLVRHKWRKGMKPQLWALPVDQGSRIYLNLVTVLNQRNRNHWKQVWICLDKDMAMKMLVLGTFPSGTIASNSTR